MKIPRDGRRGHTPTVLDFPIESVWSNNPIRPNFDGNRWNDLHYTNATKGAARGRALGRSEA